MSNTAGGSKADTMFKLVLIFFISLLSFSVGTYVGKQVSDSDYRRASLEMNFNSQSQVANASANATNPATKPISDQQTKSLAQEFINAARKPASVGDQATDGQGAVPSDNQAATAAQNNSANSDDLTGYAPVNTGNNAQASAAPTKNVQDARGTASINSTTEAVAANRVAHELAPAKNIKIHKPHVRALPSVATTAIGKYTVQIASYATVHQAKARAAKLKQKGYSAFYVPAIVRGHKWYRVSIGLFADQKGAMDYRTELIATKAVKSAIVQKIVR